MSVSNGEQINTDKGYTPTNPPAPEEPGAVMPAGDDGGTPSESNGDECDGDDDADGVPDTSDNCQLVRNPNQQRTKDPIAGDACVRDRDTDDVPDGRDNCPDGHNPGQENLDGDGLGDACDLDDDGDGVPDASDNCPRVPNFEQGDADQDGIGTACDPGEATGSGSSTTTGPGPTGPGTVPGTPTSIDSTAPKLTLVRPARWTADDLRGGSPIAVGCSEACGLTARLTLRNRLVATGTALLGGRGRTFIFLKPRRGAVAAIARLRRATPATLTVRAVDEAGNRRTVTRRLKLRR